MIVELLHSYGNRVERPKFKNDVHSFGLLEVFEKEGLEIGNFKIEVMCVFSTCFQKVQSHGKKGLKVFHMG